MTATDTLAGLTAAVLAEPACDVVRGAYADEIEATDPTRAKFVRVQLEIARGDDRCDRGADQLSEGLWRMRCRCRPCTLRRREWEYVRDNRFFWHRWVLPDASADCQSQFGNLHPPSVGPASPPLADDDWLWLFAQDVVTFRRGFPAAFRMPLAAWQKYGPRVVRDWPVEMVATDAEPYDETDDLDASSDAGFRWHGVRDYWIENAGGGTPTCAVGGLPIKLVRLMPPHPDHRKMDAYLTGADGDLIRTYPTRELAHEVLSAALIALARATPP